MATGEDLRVIVQAVALISLIWAAGGPLYVLALAGRSEHADRTARAATALAVTLGALSLSVLVPLQLLAIGGDWAAALDPFTLELWAAGAAAAGLRAGGLLALTVWLTVWRSPAPGLAGAGAIILSFAFAGHVVSHEPSVLLRLALMVHVLAAAFWLGALAPLRAAALSETPAVAASLMDAFAVRMGAGLMALLFAGVLLAVLLSGAWPWRWAQSDWGRGLLVKLGCIALLLGLAGFHRFVLTQGLREGRPQAGARLARSISLEILVALSVLAATAAFAYRFSPEGG